MGRKNLLSGLLVPQSDEPTSDKPQLRPIEPIGSALPGARGVIGAVSRSIEQLRSHSVVELAPELVDSSFVTDRLDGGAAIQAELTEQIREHGQQVPILVRPHPAAEGRYQVVYGHRRLKAAAALGRTIKAVVRSLSDVELVIAQGQENSARADLTFIERALFAAALEDRGFDRATIMAALAVDKFGLSKLISSAVKIPRDIIEAIGPATRTGRDKWQAMAAKLEKPGAVEIARTLAVQWVGSDKNSDQRFQELSRVLGESDNRGNEAEPPVFTNSTGRQIAVLREASGFSNVRIDKRVSPGFGAFVFERLPELYAAFEKVRGDE
jgi:ParB family chromosome partitioning protein